MRFSVLVISIAVLVLDRSLVFGVNTPDQPSQHRKDTFQGGLANPIQLRIDRLERLEYIVNRSGLQNRPTQSRKTDSCLSDFASHYPRKCWLDSIGALAAIDHDLADPDDKMTLPFKKSMIGIRSQVDKRRVVRSQRLTLSFKSNQLRVPLH